MQNKTVMKHAQSGTTIQMEVIIYATNLSHPILSTYDENAIIYDAIFVDNCG
jgi:hypothetical protein